MVASFLRAVGAAAAVVGIVGTGVLASPGTVAAAPVTTISDTSSCGLPDQITAPSGVTSMTVFASAGAGGVGGAAASANGFGGASGGGSHVIATFTITGGETFTAITGCAGADAPQGGGVVGTGGLGGAGYGAGGSGGTGDFCAGVCGAAIEGPDGSGGGGGGSTALCPGTGCTSSPFVGTPLLIVAGGGGGGESMCTGSLGGAGGAGGQGPVNSGSLGAESGSGPNGLNGVDGEEHPPLSGGDTGGAGGTNSHGFSPAGTNGGDGQNENFGDEAGGGGGGAGYNGGKGSPFTGADDCQPGGGGGGGSTWVDSSATGIQYSGATAASDGQLSISFGLGTATPTIGTTVFDASTNAAWSGTEGVGASAYDVATLSGSSGTPTGSVTFNEYNNGTCNGSPATTTSSVPLSSGAANSGTATLTNAGAYSFQAVYNGDSTYTIATGSCERFNVSGTAAANVTTTVDDATTNAAWPAGGSTDTSSYDTAQVSGGSGTPTGTLTYKYYSDSACTPADLVSTDANEPISSGTVHNSTAVSSTPGQHSWQATYNGDTTYAPSTGSCEPFTVIPTIGTATATVLTTVYDATTNQPWPAGGTTDLNSYDLAQVTGFSGVPSGTVSFNYYSDGNCATLVGTDANVRLDGGATARSSTGTNVVGTHSYKVSYNGDPTYNTATGTCETFMVNSQTTPTVRTTVFDATTKAAWSGTEVGSAKAYDTTKITGLPGVSPSGTVDYSFYRNAKCSGTAAKSQVVTLNASGTVPHSSQTAALAPGTYSYSAMYSGDAHYLTATAACEKFTVNKYTPTLSTTVFDAGTNAAWAGTEVAGAQSHDTATVGGVAGVTPTGTVQYTLFSGSSCTGSPLSATQTVSLATDGSVPDSATSGVLTAGDYSYSVAYSGDKNYAAPSPTCEHFTVLRTSPGLATQSSATVRVGGTVSDSVTISGGFEMTGQTVTFDLFGPSQTPGCSGTPVTQLPATLVANGTNFTATSGSFQPTEPGAYYWIAVYGSDANNNGVSGNCGDPNESVDVVGLTPSASTLPEVNACGQTFSQTFSTGLPGYTYSATSPLPPTLTFNSSTGVLSGPLTAAGHYSFRITATGPLSVSQTYLFPVGPCIDGGNPVVPAGTHGQAYSFTLTGSRGTAPYRFVLVGGGLPPGLSLAPSGLISGTPSMAGTYTFTAQVLDSATAVNVGNMVMTLTIS
jgi:hypothetical protein